MRIECTSTAVRVLAPAKVNLFLEVLGKRSDGFHEVRTVLCPISLFDTLVFEVVDAPGIQFDLQLPAVAEREVAWQIAADENNLVVRAARCVQQTLGIRRGCRIRLEKSIPSSAGLGGGSSDAAAAVTASLIAWDRWNRPLAEQICASIGSDVPFFLGDNTQIGLATGTGRGERCQQIDAQPKLEFVVTHPPVGCSTKAVYDRFEEAGNPRHFAEIVAACKIGKSQKIGAELFNALQSPASRLTDWIERQLRLFADCGANHALMTGSGSSCFALIEEPSVEKRIKESAAAIGLNRAYTAKACYGNSIEQQLKRQIGQSRK